MSKNLLVNGDFFNWRRGNVLDETRPVHKPTTNSYTADRWVIVTSQEPGQVPYRLNYQDGIPGFHAGARFVCRTPGHKVGLFQTIEHPITSHAKNEWLGGDLSVALSARASGAGVKLYMAVFGYTKVGWVDNPRTRHPIANFNAAGVAPTLNNDWEFRVGPVECTLGTSVARFAEDAHVVSHDFNTCVGFWIDPLENEGDWVDVMEVCLNPGLSNYDFEPHHIALQELMCERHFYTTFDQREWTAYPTFRNCRAYVAAAANAGTYVTGAQAPFWLRETLAEGLPDTDPRTGAVPAVFSPQTGAQGYAWNATTSADVPVAYDHASPLGFFLRPTSGVSAGNLIKYQFTIFNEIG